MSKENEKAAALCVKKVAFVFIAQFFRSHFHDIVEIHNNLLTTTCRSAILRIHRKPTIKSAVNFQKGVSPVYSEAEHKNCHVPRLALGF